MSETEENEIQFPNWLEDVFILMLVNYDTLWLATISDERQKRMKKLLWLESLQKYNPETVMRAAKEIMLRCPTYPPRIGELCVLCEEFGRTNRYTALQLENHEEFKRAKMPAEIRKMLGLKERT